MVEWRAVPGFPGYMVSSDGAVSSVDRMVVSTRHKSGLKRIKGRTLKPFGDGHGYATVTFTGQVKRKVHQAVADAFLGPCPPKHEVRHLDGNPANNCVSNLAYGTRAQNVADAIAHGTFTRGEKNGVAKLSDKQVASIKAMLEIGARGVDVAFAFGVSKQAISSIRAGHNWAHIQPDRGF